MRRFAWLLSLCALGCKLPHEVAFPGARGARPAPVETLRQPDGPPVVYTHAPAPAGASTIAWFHGNAQQLADLALVADYFARAGLGFYAVEYPGYALADGHATEGSVLRAADVALAHLHDSLGVPPSSIVLVGQSVGSFVATRMAARGHGRALVLISAFTSADDLAYRLVGFPGPWMLRDHLRTSDTAPLVRAPVLLVHGTRDELIPGSMSEDLAQLFPDSALVWVKGVGHNDLMPKRRDEVLGLVVAVEGVTRGQK